MQVSGEWHLCDDGVERPVVHGRVAASDGSWVLRPLLLDTGADRTVFSADTLVALDLQTLPQQERLEGLGGGVRSFVVETTIQLFEDRGAPVTFQGRFAAVAELEALDMSVLGRDITSLFEVLVDRPGSRVCLVGQHHQCAIVER
jgi:hypothetical protein